MTQQQTCCQNCRVGEEVIVFCPLHAAAQELLTALKELLPEEAGTKECDCGCEGDGEGMCDYTDALAAIAKASPQAR